MKADLKFSYVHPAATLTCLMFKRKQYEPPHEKTNNSGFRPGPTQTRLYSDSIKLEAWNFEYK